MAWTSSIDGNGFEAWKRDDGLALYRDDSGLFYAVTLDGQKFKVKNKLKKWRSARVAKYDLDFICPDQGRKP